MKQLFYVLLALGLAAGPSRPARAQTTNGMNTGAERQAQSDAYTRSEQQRVNRIIYTSPGANTPSSSGSGRAQTFTERTAEINAMFGFETAEQKAAARLAVIQRNIDRNAAEQRKDDAKKAAVIAERKEAAEDNKRRITTMVPWHELGFEISDCSELGFLSSRYTPTPSIVQVLEQARAARPAFAALYAQPTASYEALRALAQQLPLRWPQSIGEDYLYGINTAIKQYDQLYERFPARRATAAADLAQAVVTYFSWFRAFDQDFEHDNFRLQKMELLQKAAAANPAVGRVAGLRLAMSIKDKFRFYITSSGSRKGAGGVVKDKGRDKFQDSVLVGQLLRFGYAGCRYYERNGQAATLGLTPEQVRSETGAQAYNLAELQLMNNQPLAAHAWLRRALEADPANESMQQGAVKHYRTILYEYPELFGALQPAEWQMLQKPMGLSEPLRVEPVQSWLADTVRLPDDPRWQTLTATEKADLQQACDIAAWLTQGEALLHYKSQLNAKRATWHFVLTTGPGPDLDKAQKLWQAMADFGDLRATRNLYRAYLLGDKLPVRPEKELLFMANRLGSNDANYTNGQKKYEAALLLLDELPGYPPLGKRFKKEGRAKLEDAALNGSEAAKARLKQGF